MICPRCGFQTSIVQCPLCDQKDFNQFELNRYSEGRHNRLEITLILSGNLPVQLNEILNLDGVKHAVTEELIPRHFFFFSDHEYESLFKILTLVRDYKGWSILINGRLRPFTQELWLPLLELTEH